MACTRYGRTNGAGPLPCAPLVFVTRGKHRGLLITYSSATSAAAPISGGVRARLAARRFTRGP